MKYYISTIPSSNNTTGGSKARKDVDVIVDSLGYQRINVCGCSSIKILRLIQYIASLVFLPFKLIFVKHLFYQYPFTLPCNQIFYWLMFHYNGNSTIFIHDLDFLRGGKKPSKREVKLIKHASALIVNTQAIKDWLSNNSFDKNKIIVTQIWDYLSDVENVKNSKFEKNIVFAGNLDKSKFIFKLNDIKANIIFNIYGSISKPLKISKTIQYRGLFNADDISTIEGDWGLVWDGDSIETCRGSYGEYLRLNSSHKIGLYMACKKPIIVWSHSAMADFVRTNNIGICVDSLQEIAYMIDNLSTDQKYLIKCNVERVSHLVKEGHYLKEALNILEN